MGIYMGAMRSNSGWRARRGEPQGEWRRLSSAPSAFEAAKPPYSNAPGLFVYLFAIASALM
jgi:hypothetical protein